MVAVVSMGLVSNSGHPRIPTRVGLYWAVTYNITSVRVILWVLFADGQSEDTYRSRADLIFFLFLSATFPLRLAVSRFVCTSEHGFLKV
jgi:hypothetical protein